jgi:hypothetical protein
LVEAEDKNDEQNWNENKREFLKISFIFRETKIFFKGSLGFGLRNKTE